MAPRAEADPQTDVEPSSSTTPSRNDRSARVAAPAWVQLTAGEDVLWTGRPSLWPVTPPILLGLGLGLLGVLLPVLAISPLEVLPFELLPVETRSLQALWLVFVPIGLLIAGRAVLTRWRVQYVITSERVYKKVDLLARDTTQLRVDHIQNTIVTQSLAGRLFSYGDLALATAGTSGTELVLADVTQVGRVTRLVADQLNGMDPR